ncbi:hypothetical protein LTR72_011808, partial [Exophiala xenobiotica]
MAETAPPKQKPKSGGRPVFTDIDRSRCQRVVPMEVLVLGMSKTATSSMKVALEKLGYKDVYHMTSILTQNPRDADLWKRAYDAVYGGKVTDVPCIDFTYELVEAYPDAKIILTTRDIDKWEESYSDTVGRYYQQYHDRYHRWYSIQKYLIPKWAVGQEWFPQRAKEEYMDQVARVRNIVRERSHDKDGKYLEFDVKQGWGPLCHFLGKDVPKEDFPRMMERDEFRE